VLAPAQGKEGTGHYVENQSGTAAAPSLRIPDAHASALSILTSQHPVRKSHIQKAALQELHRQQHFALPDVHWSPGKPNAANSKLQKEKAKAGKSNSQHHQAGKTEEQG